MGKGSGGVTVALCHREWKKHLADVSGIGPFPTSQPLFFLFVPWKEEGGDLIVFGCGPGHDQSYQKLVGRSQLSPKVRLFHPVAEMQRARAARSFSR